MALALVLMVYLLSNMPPKTLSKPLLSSAVQQVVIFLFVILVGSFCCCRDLPDQKTLRDQRIKATASPVLILIERPSKKSELPVLASSEFLDMLKNCEHVRA